MNKQKGGKLLILQTPGYSNFVMKQSAKEKKYTR